MFEFKEILMILLIHWLADFCLQTDEQAKRKSVEGEYLFYHCFTYSLVWLFFSSIILESLKLGAIFAFVTYVTHTGIDFFTSRISKPFWEKNDTHNGFVVVGFDQILHYIQLFLTYNWLKSI